MHCEACREALKAYFAGLKADLLNKRLANWRRNTSGWALKCRGWTSGTRARRRRTGTASRHCRHGGDRSNGLPKPSGPRRRKGRRARKAERYATGSISRPADAGQRRGFHRQPPCLRTLGRGNGGSRGDAPERIERTGGSSSRSSGRYGRSEHELAGLRARRSNIDQAQIPLGSFCVAPWVTRGKTCLLPELLQVREDEKDWEGAAERMLRNFGLSLLVPDRHYAKVAEWVTVPISRDAWSISGTYRWHGDPASACIPTHW